MRAIAKQESGGYQLSQAHAHPPQTPQQATSRWGSFGQKGRPIGEQVLQKQAPELL
jgi:hypothetical protein